MTAPAGDLPTADVAATRRAQAVCPAGNGRAWPPWGATGRRHDRPSRFGWRPRRRRDAGGRSRVPPGVPPRAAGHQAPLSRAAPASTGDERGDVLLVALAEHLAARRPVRAGMDVGPEARCLLVPFDTAAARADALVHTPAAFRRRDVFGHLGDARDRGGSGPSRGGARSPTW